MSSKIKPLSGEALTEPQNTTELENLQTLKEKFGLPVLFRFTETGLNKDYVDATAPMRALLRVKGLHDYEEQPSGPEFLSTVIVDIIPDAQGIRKTSATFFKTTRGDTRCRIADADKFFRAWDLVSVVVVDKQMVVVDITSQRLFDPAQSSPSRSDLAILDLKERQNDIPVELRRKIQRAAARGEHGNVVAKGTSGVGETLEKSIGLKKNTDKRADYRGIEIKSSKNRFGFFVEGNEDKSLFTLFTENPHETVGSEDDRKVVFGAISDVYYESSDDQGSLFATPKKASRADIEELDLALIRGRDRREKLVLRRQLRPVAFWDVEQLEYRLLEKHAETFWIEAVCTRTVGENDRYRYTKIYHTKDPDFSVFRRLLMERKVAVEINLRKKKLKLRQVAFRVQKKYIATLFRDPVKMYPLPVPKTSEAGGTQSLTQSQTR